MVCSAAKSLKLFYGSLFKRSDRGSETHFLTCYFQLFSYFLESHAIKLDNKIFFKGILLHFDTRAWNYVSFMTGNVFSRLSPGRLCQTIWSSKVTENIFSCPKATKDRDNKCFVPRHVLVRMWNRFLCCISTNGSLETRLFDTESGCSLMNQLLYVNRSRIINLNWTLMTP